MIISTSYLLALGSLFVVAASGCTTTEAQCTASCSGYCTKNYNTNQWCCRQPEFK
ncbi:hypothetical protein Vi05172_g9518 [Venturia inaequalis]|nr:hypothetical protein Vi05172_g9518 [Venturia inaequalis]